MRTLNRQQGMGMLSMLIIAVMVGFFVMSGIRIAPGFIEYQTIRELVLEAAESYDDDEDTISDIRRALASSFNMNQIKTITPGDVEIVREDGKLIVNGNYEDRIPLFWRIDAVVKYDDLVFVAGERYSDE